MFDAWVCARFNEPWVAARSAANHPTRDVPASLLPVDVVEGLVGEDEDRRGNADPRRDVFGQVRRCGAMRSWGKNAGECL